MYSMVGTRKDIDLFEVHGNIKWEHTGQHDESWTG